VAAIGSLSSLWPQTYLTSTTSLLRMNALACELSVAARGPTRRFTRSNGDLCYVIH